MIGECTYLLVGLVSTFGVAYLGLQVTRLVLDEVLRMMESEIDITARVGVDMLTLIPERYANWVSMDIDEQLEVYQRYVITYQCQRSS